MKIDIEFDLQCEIETPVAVEVSSTDISMLSAAEEAIADKEVERFIHQTEID